MGILGLSRLIGDICPEAIKEVDMKAYFGRRIAIDASMSLYQFLIAIRNNSNVMTNEDGETTSHLIGLFYRTCKLLENGIKPVYVFDGSAPELKGKELQKRKERRKEAEEGLAKAETAADVSKFSKRLVRVTRQHNEDCQKLLRLMGLPVIRSPSEAEAQCAYLCRKGLVYAVATEDMDALTFGANRLIRNLSSGRSDDKCKEFDLQKVLHGLELTTNEFVDLCILMGCDYCNSIRGIGGKKGLELMKKFHSIEDILEKKYNFTDIVDVDVTYAERKLDAPIDVEKLLKEDVKDEPDDGDCNPTKNGNGKEEKSVEGNESGDKLDKGTDGNGENGDQIKTESTDGEEAKGNQNGKSEETKPEDMTNGNGKVEGNSVEGDKQNVKLEVLVAGDSTDEEHADADNTDSDLETTKRDEKLESDEDDDEVTGRPKKKKNFDDDFIDDEEEEEDDKKKPKKKSEKAKKKDVKKDEREVVPTNWLFKGARKLFLNPNVDVAEITDADLVIKNVDEEGLIQFMCVENGFSEERVRSGIKRIQAAKGKSSQTRIDTFFKSVPQSADKMKCSKKDASKRKSATNGKAGSSNKKRKGK